ncbi:MAG: hypothetical protein ACRDRO_17295 [Pseudonocardiaceae bacterium]
MSARNQKKVSFDLAEQVKKSTKASGVPLKVKDKSVLRRIAQMLK